MKRTITLLALVIFSLSSLTACSANQSDGHIDEFQYVINLKNEGFAKWNVKIEKIFNKKIIKQTIFENTDSKWTFSVVEIDAHVEQYSDNHKFLFYVCTVDIEDQNIGKMRHFAFGEGVTYDLRERRQLNSYPEDKVKFIKWVETQEKKHEHRNSILRDMY